tara:strand:+ start:256 stop:747 length:492 start_codon:yes stop_codon:yes gene_type:complete
MSRKNAIKNWKLLFNKLSKIKINYQILLDEKIWYTLNDITCNDFILHILKFGKPIEISLVGAFDDKGRGHRRDIELPFHKDGEYSAKISKQNNESFDKKVDIVGLYCIRSGEAKTLIKCRENISEIKLKQNQGIIFDNQKCLHSRTGVVGDRILLRVWIEKKI